jgi:IMP dehydrogenase
MKNVEIPLGLTFDDVLLVPQYSEVNSRSQINMNSRFSRNVPLKIPIVSSP